MTPWLKTIIGVIIVVIVGVGGLFIYQMSQSRNNDYQTIAQHWTKGGKFIDYSQDLGVEDANDLKYFINTGEERVEIDYGYVKLFYTFDELDTEEVKDELYYIGITYEKNKKGDKYRFYWKGVLLEQWAHSNVVA